MYKGWCVKWTKDQACNVNFLCSTAIVGTLNQSKLYNRGSSFTQLVDITISCIHSPVTLYPVRVNEWHLHIISPNHFIAIYYEILKLRSGKEREGEKEKEKRERQGKDLNNEKLLQWEKTIPNWTLERNLSKIPLSS